MKKHKNVYGEKGRAWAKLKPQKRTALLKSLGVKDSRLTRDIGLAGVARTKYFGKLPIPIRTVLESAYSDGRFSLEIQTRRRVSLAAVMRDFDRAEHEYENAPD